MVTGDDWGQKQAEGAQEVGEGTLFWLTAYLQLGNCILKYFNLSNIYKYVIGNLTATITLTSLWPVPVLSPTFLPVGSQFRESREPVPQRQSPALTALGTGEETGPALRIYSALSFLPHRKLTGGGEACFGLFTPLPSCSVSRDGFVVHQEAWKHGTAVGVRSGLPALAERCQCTLRSGTRGPRGHPRLLDQWLLLGPEMTRTVTVLRDRRPCC